MNHLLSINRVMGDSMSPSIPANSFIIFHGFFFKKRLRVGQIVKVKHPVYGVIVKRITAIDSPIASTSTIWLRGENQHSVTTQQMGPIKLEHILGVAAWIIKPPTKSSAINA